MLSIKRTRKLVKRRETSENLMSMYQVEEAKKLPRHCK